MFLILTALMLEAGPLARDLGLKALGGEPYPIFQGKDLVLVAGGVGSLQAGIATGWAMARFPGIRMALNLGFCGASPSVAALHTWHYVSSIRDQVTGRLSLPDILWKHPFPEAALLTVPRVVNSPSEWGGLVDMEGSGFYEAARQFLAPDRIALLKWVSDPLTGRIDVEETKEAFASSLEPVIGFISSWAAVHAPSERGRHEAVVDQILGRIRLTVTQTRFIRKWIGGYIARGGDPEGLLKLLPERMPPTRKGNTLIFEALKDVLKN